MSTEIESVSQKILTHLHRRTVVGSINSIALILGMRESNAAMNPRFKDLKAIYEQLGEERRGLFYAAVAAITEFAVYGTLDFIETYNRFDSEDNDEALPSLALVYRSSSPEGIETTAITEFGSENLGQRFRQIARQDNAKALVESAIKKVAP
jgi:hypothetical protein